MCLLRRQPINNIIEVVVAGVDGLDVLECKTNNQYSFEKKRDYVFKNPISSVAVVKEGKSILVSEFGVSLL